MTSNYLVSLLKRYFRTGSVTKPANFYFGLLATMPDATGANGVEVAGGGYARSNRMGPGDANWHNATPNGCALNATAAIFPAPTGDWGTVVGFAAFDSATPGAGNLLFASPLPEPVTIKAGDPPFEIARYDVTLQFVIGGFSQYLANYFRRFFMTASLSKPSALYFCLFTTMPDEADANGVEVAGSGYARAAAYYLNDAGWNDASARAVRNAKAISFPAPTGDWGDVVGFGAYDYYLPGVAGQNLLLTARLPQPITIKAGDPPFQFAPGEIQIEFDRSAP